ncbi:hypothetical protein [Metamycoplasma hyosynoviae]|uniref:hypothetical protein n=1 Tax=Metamycoplasma hyosynoviae TaxID=29559 RepID=UPI002358D1EB|nr:hypothetical protein [Metamycoplasma hyosynoviae]MDC8920248.1 hypothetical protein [Metamycoplasma hyosynoviae]MDC8937306.1 hypothetical protein [Metamycoplasma hyosynoviae]MDD1359409.1 hypothetical protein [Metamycoplasma hyosynoviae]MDD1360084.1 hypothetical protein [Metamycoplasma hyosynoviae]MDD1365967.1 hypothetical protein [Metamycoplasma hyosynoviae]
MNYDTPIEHKIEVKGMKFQTKESYEQRRQEGFENFKKRVEEGKTDYRVLISAFKFLLEMIFTENGHLIISWEDFAPKNSPKIPNKRPDFFDKTIRSIGKYPENGRIDYEIKRNIPNWLESDEHYSLLNASLDLSQSANFLVHPLIVRYSVRPIMFTFARSIYYYDEKYYIPGLGALVGKVEEYLTFKEFWASRAKAVEPLFLKYLMTVFEPLREFRNNYIKSSIKKVPGKHIRYESLDDRIIIDDQTGRIILLKDGV